MEKEKCKRCGKKLEGYSRQHVAFLLKQHELSKNCISTNPALMKALKKHSKQV